MTTQTTTIATQDYNLLIGALKQIKYARFVGAEEAVKNNRWHEYAARLQQIASDALLNALEVEP